MPHCSIKELYKVKEQFHLGNTFDPKEFDRRVTLACSYEALPSYMDVQWSEIERARRACASERQEQRHMSLTNTRDTDE